MDRCEFPLINGFFSIIVWTLALRLGNAGVTPLNEPGVGTEALPIVIRRPLRGIFHPKAKRLFWCLAWAIWTGKGWVFPTAGSSDYERTKLRRNSLQLLSSETRLENSELFCAGTWVLFVETLGNASVLLCDKSMSRMLLLFRSYVIAAAREEF